MPATRITVDGLWRCLCPSIDSAALSRALSRPFRPQQTRTRPAAANKTTTTTTTTKTRALGVRPRRCLHTTSRRLRDDQEENEREQDSSSVASNTAVATTGQEQQPTAHAASAPNPGEEKPAGEHHVQAPRPSDSVKLTGKDMPLATGEQGAAEAWRGYFDVVFDTGGTRRRNPPGTAGRDPLVDIYAPEEEEAQREPMTKGQVYSTLAGGATNEADPFVELFDAETTQREDLLEIADLQDWLPPPVEYADAGRNAFDKMAGQTASKESITSSSYAQKPEDMPKGRSTSPTTRDAETSDGSVDGMFGSAETTQDASGVSPPVHNEPVLHDDTDMVKRILNLRAIPPEATKDDLDAVLWRVRMEPHRKYRLLTAACLKHLICKLGVQPRPFHYDTLFRAHALPEGSVDVVVGLLKEMRERKIAWSATAYHSVLRLLAVHPDYLVRNDMIREMKERWLEIRPNGHRYIAIGLLRDGQYELALEKLDDMANQGIEIDPWVFYLFIYVFGKLELLDDALRIARYAVYHGLDLPVNVWYYLLDVCSKGQHHDGTTYVWNRTVSQGIVNPSDGVCLNILNMSSVYGDTQLATEVIQYLAQRGTRLARPHYEALADAYCMQGNVERAIEVYCIMYGAGAEVSQLSAGTLSQSLARDPSLIGQAVEAMTELKTRYKLPVGIYNTVLNEMIKSSALPANDAYLQGLDLYQRIKDFVPTGPNIDTFRILLRRCTNPDIAQFFVGEMVMFRLRQDLLTKELLFKVHVESPRGPLHRAKYYFYHISAHLHSSYRPGSRRWQNIMDLSVQLVKRLIAAGDPGAWRILEICQRNGLEEEKIAALREEVEAGKVPVAVEDPLSPDLPKIDSSGLKKVETTELMP